VTAAPRPDLDIYRRSGESYAGKYIPAIAHTVVTSPEAAAANISLAGIAIGNGWTEPVTQSASYSEYAYGVGLIDERQRAAARLMQDSCAAAVKAGDLAVANDVCNALTTFILASGGNPSPFDVRSFGVPEPAGYEKWLAREDVRRALHANHHRFGSTAGLVSSFLTPDIFRSEMWRMPTVLQKMRVLVYNGQFDFICNHLGQQAAYYNLPWPGAADYKAAERAVWKLDGRTAGFVRTAHTLTEVIVTNAGHLAPWNQPATTLDMIKRFVLRPDIPFNEPWLVEDGVQAEA
jgi:vitellogenic carboxypeptidase-like protein